MAYEYTVKTEVRRLAGFPREWHVLLVETDVGTGDEWRIGAAPDTKEDGNECPFLTCRLKSYRSAKITGTCTTLDPTMGKKTGWGAASLDHAWTNGTPAALVESEPGTIIRFRDHRQSLFGRTEPDAGADNVVHTEMIFVDWSSS